MSRQAYKERRNDEIQMYMERKKELTRLLNERENVSEMTLFMQVNNDPNKFDQEFDLHGQFKVTAIRITRDRLNEIQQKLNNG
jgi:hypothetical protein